MYQALQRLPAAVSALAAHSGPHSPLLMEAVGTPLSELQDDFSKFAQLVEATVNLDLVEHHEFMVKPSMDEGLQRKC